MATELFQACNAVFSGVRGALANATIGACALFGAICGSSIATAATFSQVAIPEMRRHGYDAGVRGRRVASAGTLDVLIPPSVLIAIYAIVAEQSLVKLYAAAFIPGFVLAALYVVAVWIVAWLRPQWIPKVAAMPLGERLRASLGMWKLGVLFFFAVFGIYLGWFSPDRGRRDGGVRRDRDRVRHRRDGLARSDRCLLETVYTTAAHFLHRGRRVHLLALHRADAVPERADGVDAGGRAVAVLDPDGGDGALISCSARSSTRSAPSSSPCR